MAGSSPQNKYNNLHVPSIDQQPRRSRSPAFYASLPHRASPMSITSATGATPPPPLPPPRYIEGITEGSDPGWEFENRANAEGERSNSAPIRPGSSLLGGHKISPVGRYTGPARNFEFDQPPRLEVPLDNGRGEGGEHRESIPNLSELLEYNKLQSEKQMGQKTLEKSSQAYDKHLLSRIGGPRTPPLKSADSPIGSTNEDTPSSANKARGGQLRPLAMPERRYSEMDTRSPQQWASTRATAATAPQSSVLSPGISARRSPQLEDGAQIDRPLALARQNSFVKLEESSMPGRLIHRNSYEGVFHDSELSAAQSPAMQQLNISHSPADTEDYQNIRTGQKRRAQSPPGDAILDPRLPSNPGFRPAQAADARNHGSTLPQFRAPGSMSSVASSMPPQNASYPSSYGLSNPSSATSYNSERLSPSAFTSEAIAARSNLGMPPPPVNNNSAPRIPQHVRAPSTNAPRPMGTWICDCCPKKPKKFESEDELRIHEMEKQYICQYCHNRFKNKNEAERHQNSLHLRRHSWSCAALTSFEAAFHSTPSTNVAASLRANNINPYSPHSNGGAQEVNPFPGLLHSTPTDTCGYCGQEFANPPNWDERVDHLNHVHKFGECNQSKKFFRADHFRQHLKHSHAGTSGKWTNQLENACMKDEPPPIPLSQQTLPPGMPGIMMVGQQAIIANQVQQQLAMQQAQQAQQQQQQQQGHHQHHEQQPQHQPGQQAMMHATGPMGAGGLPPPIALPSPRDGFLTPGSMHHQQHGYFGQPSR